MIRAFIYCRLSREGGKSVERQERLGRKIAADRGWDVAEVFKEWVSASQFSKKAREQWDRLIDTIEALEDGRDYAVILWMEDRSARHILQGWEFVKVCKQVGLNRIVLPSYDYDLADAEDEARYMGQVLRAQEEIARLSKRVRAARLEEATEGVRHGGGTREFGARGRRRVIDADGNQRTEFIVSEAQAARERELIRQAADRILAGDSLRAIRLDWATQGVTTPSTEARLRKGQPPAAFSNQMLRKLLLSPRLAGYRVHRTYTEQNGKRVLVKEDLYPSEEYPVIVEPAKWEAVKRVLTDPDRTTNHRGGLPRHELSGLLYCGLCGRRMYSRPRGKGLYVYRCAPERGANSCGRVSRDAARLEKLIREALFRGVEDPKLAQLRKPAAEDADPTRPHVEAVAEITRDLDVLDGMLAEAELAERQGRKPTPSTATLRRKVAERERERDRHEAAVARLQGRRVAARVPRNLRQLWPDLNLDRRRAILAALIERIEVHPQAPLGPGGFDPAAIKVTWRDGT